MQPVPYSPLPTAVPEAPAATDQRPGATPGSPARRAFEEGWSDLLRGLFREAARSFERAAEESSGTPLVEDAHFWRAVALARAGEGNLAVPAFQDFLSDHPQSVRRGEAHVILGWLLFQRGDFSEAARHFQVAAQDQVTRVRESAAAGLRALPAAPP